MEKNDFTGWIKSSEYFTYCTPVKVRVRRVDGSLGYSIARFALDSYHIKPGLTQEYWEDLNGTLRNKDFYLEWAFLRKDGGKV